ncbi:MAG TPA: YfiR family protein [Bacteroidales bacterium]|nr:YfiR family protein [Bacteroidales bacterium]
MKKFFLSVFVLLMFVKFSNGQVGINQAKASFIYNFTKFFDWPQTEKSGDFIIGVYGSRELFTELEKATSGKKNVTQNIIVKNFSNKNDISKCHVIFIEAQKSDQISNIHELTGVHCLIISDSYSAIEKGAVIQFISEGDKLKYAFSGGNALKHGLKYHSKVSEMASKNY